jgi:hypothetical protein
MEDAMHGLAGIVNANKAVCEAGKKVDEVSRDDRWLICNALNTEAAIFAAYDQKKAPPQAKQFWSEHAQHLRGLAVRIVSAKAITIT